jgi:hypothetical protein
MERQGKFLRFISEITVRAEKNGIISARIKTIG